MEIKLTKRDALFLATGIAAGGVVDASLSCGRIPERSYNLQDMQAAIDSAEQLYENTQNVPFYTSPLRQALGYPSLHESRIGLAGGHFWEPAEMPRDLIPNFYFPIDPTFADKRYAADKRILTFGNIKTYMAFRNNDPEVSLEEYQKRLSDRAIYLMNNGWSGSAVIELDSRYSDAYYAGIIKDYAKVGVKTFYLGNEPNDPRANYQESNVPWINKRLFLAGEELRKSGLKDVELGLPPLAYFGVGEYWDRLQRDFNAKFPGEKLPFTRAADNFYDHPSKLLPYVKQLDARLQKLGLSNIKLDLTEVGNPAADKKEMKLTEQEIAEGFIPAVLSLGIGSRLVDRMFYFSLLHTTNKDHSLAAVSNRKLVPKRSYLAFENIAMLFSRLDAVGIWGEDQDITEVRGARSDGVQFSVVWSNIKDAETNFKIHEQDQVFNVYGEKVPTSSQAVTLPPSANEYVTGSTRIILKRNQ